ncbi:MAG TPA: hypothetical protein DCG12_08945 [Planctomycetaceae bacterium]|nr:hypothetical protein [Planctomycetaceae bacterium]
MTRRVAFGFGTVVHAEAPASAVQAFQLSADVIVYYDPADPSSAVLMTGVSSEEKYMLGTGSHFFRCDRC